MQSLREQSLLCLALLWPRRCDGEKGGDGEEGVDGLLLQALPPESCILQGAAMVAALGLLLGL